MTDKKPFDKEHGAKISFSELVELIGTSCDYKFCIIDENIDDELLELAAKHNINLKGYKHVIETLLRRRSANEKQEPRFQESAKKTTKKPLITRGYLCYRWREHAEARPLRLDNALVFHSVSATNCWQKYNKIYNPTTKMKNNLCFSTINAIQNMASALKNETFR